MRLTVPLIACLLAVSLARTAHADTPETATTEFGGAILVTDAAVLGLGLGLASKGAAPLLMAFPIAAPIVHVVNGDPLGAFGSLALHIGLPLMGGVAGIYGGQAACHRGGWDCPMTAIGVGVLAGAVTATLVDSAFLAHVERPVPRRAPGVPVPTVAMAPGGGVVLGVAGRL